MKFVIVSFVVGVIILTLAAFVKKATLDTETHKYEVLETFDEFEIRRYEPALYSSVKLSSSSYKETSSKGFRTLAGYIFGDNDRDEKIAMTSPVTMELEDTSKMMFMVPQGMTRENLPKPKNESVYFEEYPARVVAAITFGGWANDQKIEKHAIKLMQLLDEQGIEYQQKFAFLGYNPPYDVVDRKNEVIIEVEWPR